MENRKPFFLSNLLKRKTQNSDDKGWGNTTDNITLNGWGSSPSYTSSGPITNSWAYEHEPPENHCNGWGSGPLPKPPSQDLPSNGWGYKKAEDQYNGWGPGSMPKPPSLETTTNGWGYETPKDEYNGWGLGSSSGSGTGSGGICSEPDPISKQANIGAGTDPVTESRQVEVETWAPLVVPSAPPLPYDGFDEGGPANVLDNADVALMNEGKNGDALCVVCWEGRVEGACVPCGHMASCMMCLHEIESKQGTCPICRAKIDKVMRIYAIQSE